MTTEDTGPPREAQEEDQAVLLYLQALEAARTAPGSFPDPETASPSLAGAEMVAGEDGDALETQLAGSVPGSAANVRALEDDFVRAAAGYGARHGVTYEGWRQAGVEGEVLARAGSSPPTE